MGFRIFLVTVVAGLGLTLPTGKQVGEWHGSARAWVNTKLENWDQQVPVDEDAYVISAEPAPVAAPAPEAPAPVVADAIKTVVSSPVAPIAPAISSTELATGLDVPTVPTDIEEADLGLYLDPTPAPAPVPAPTVVLSDADFDAAQGEFITGFVHEQIAADQVAASILVQAPTVEKITDAAFDAAQDAFVTGFVAEQTAAIAARKLEAASTPEVARVDTAVDTENLYEGLAYSLNREAEGLEPMPLAAAKPAGEAKPSDRDGRLTNAVRLTRDAVYAWANLLHGPAVVTIGR